LLLFPNSPFLPRPCLFSGVSFSPLPLSSPLLYCFFTVLCSPSVPFYLSTSFRGDLALVLCTHESHTYPPFPSTGTLACSVRALRDFPLGEQLALPLFSYSVVFGFSFSPFAPLVCPPFFTEVEPLIFTPSCPTWVPPLSGFLRFAKMHVKGFSSQLTLPFSGTRVETFF